MTWLRFTVAALLTVVLASAVLERQRRADLVRLRALHPRCIGDARAEGMRF